jgi:hypothetical protein
MSVEENGLIEITLNFGENDWTQFLDFDDLGFGSFDFELLNPVFDVLGCLFEKAIGLPVGIKTSGEVGYFNIVHDGWEVGFVENLFDEFLAGLNVKLFGFHFDEKESGVIVKFI